MSRLEGEIPQGVKLLTSSTFRYFEFRASKELTIPNTGAIAVVFGLFLDNLVSRAIERFI